jgi:DNA replication protein DnaC
VAVRRVGLDYHVDIDGHYYSVPHRLILEPLGPEQRHDLREIIEDRYGRSVTLITSQIPIDRWHHLIGEPTLADAILASIVHNAHRLQLRGDSLRKQKAPKIAAA